MFQRWKDRSARSIVAPPPGSYALDEWVNLPSSVKHDFYEDAEAALSASRQIQKDPEATSHKELKALPPDTGHRLTLVQKNLLEPWSQIYARLEERIERLDDQQLRDLNAAAAVCSTGNCWVMTYRVAQILRRVTSDEMVNRARESARCGSAMKVSQ